MGPKNVDWLYVLAGLLVSIAVLATLAAVTEHYVLAGLLVSIAVLTTLLAVTEYVDDRTKHNSDEDTE